MKSSKKILVALLTMGFMSQAHGFVSLSMGGIPGFVFGLFGSVTTGISVGELILKPQEQPLLKLAIAGLSIVLLDEHSQHVRFQPLRSQQLAALGISQDEALTYNSELALVNIAFEETVLQTTRDSQLTDTAVVSLWRQNAMDAGVSQSTLTVVQKLSRASQL